MFPEKFPSVGLMQCPHRDRTVFGLNSAALEAGIQVVPGFFPRLLECVRFDAAG
jgi:hypothetical protein